MGVGRLVAEQEERLNAIDDQRRRMLRSL